MGCGALCHALCQSDSQTAWDDGGVMLKNAHTSTVLSVNWIGHVIGSRLFLWLSTLNFKKAIKCPPPTRMNNPVWSCVSLHCLCVSLYLLLLWVNLC